MAAWYLWGADSQIAQAHFNCDTAPVLIGGTASDDFLKGDGGDPSSHDHRDTMNGYGGNDHIEGYSCRDEIYGGTAGDDIHGGWGPDDLYGGPGSEEVGLGGQIVAGEDNDWANGEDGQDLVWTGSTSQSDTDELLGGPDDDRVQVLDGDTKDTGRGNGGTDDECWYDLAGDTVEGCETYHPG